MELSNHQVKKQLYMKQTPKLVSEIINQIVNRCNAEEEISPTAFLEIEQLDKVTKEIGITDIVHITETLRLMLVQHDGKVTLPCYMERAFIQLLNEILKLLQTDNPIQDRLPKIKNESILSVVKEYSSKGDPKTILIIDGDLLFLNKLSQLLSETGFTVIKSNRGKQALAALTGGTPDCIICGMNLVDVEIDLYFEQLHHQVKDRFTPIIAVLEKANSTELVDKVKFFVDDLIMKPIIMDDLFQKMMRFIDHTSRMRKQVYVDELTNIYSRKYIMERLEYYFCNPVEKEFCHSLIILDLDYFKHVNDHLGHTVGDKVLVQFANFISSKIRSSDIFARYGGEEFILLFPRTSTKIALKKVESLREEFSKVSIATGDTAINQTFSGGIISNKDVTTDSPVELLNLADIALYEAKNNGRNQVVVFNANMNMKKKEYKILIVDDDRFTRKILVDGLQEKNWELLEATNGKEALEIANQDFPNIILLDGIMPEMNGYEVLEILRSNIRFKQTAIIMLTGNHSDENIVQALNAGADDYITKPFSIVELKARINRFLVRH